MRHRPARLAAGGAAAALAALALQTVGAHSAVAQPFGYRDLTPMQQRLLSGQAAYFFAHPASGGSSSGGAHASSIVVGGGDDDAATEQDSAAPANYYPADSHGCPVDHGSNTRVNQDCTTLSDPDLQGRGQAQNETWIASDPSDPNHLVATYNDYRRGDGTCGASYSHDGGSTWADVTMPDSFTRGDAFGRAREYWQAGGDTSAAFDTKGNAYLSCQLFNRGGGVSPNNDASSGFFVYRSTGNGGASYNFPGRPVEFNTDAAGTSGILEDKQLITVDNHPSSPFRDRVYVTWTRFAADGTAYIYEAFSSDYGESFSDPVLVSSGFKGCDQTYGLPTPQGPCNENQFSQPFTGSDGALHVVFDNFNNAVKGNDNRNQVLIATSTDGGRTFGKAHRAAWYYDLPDCATYQNGQDAGRACVPEKAPTANSIFRATNYPVGAVDPRDSSHVVVTVGSYINQHSNESNGCVPAGFSGSTGQDLYRGVKQAGACNNDILISTSRDGGATFDGQSANPRVQPVVTTDPGQATTDQFWPAISYTSSGRLAVGYYDRQYDHDERVGSSDVSVSGSGDGVAFGVVRATTSPMPPPTQFSGLFYGDYIGMTTIADQAWPIWSDTRNAEPFLCPGTATPTSPPQVCEGSAPNAARANDQDAYTTRVPVANRTAS